MNDLSSSEYTNLLSMPWRIKPVRNELYVLRMALADIDGSPMTGGVPTSSFSILDA